MSDATGETARHWIPAPDRAHEAVLLWGTDGWTLRLPDGERVKIDVTPSPDAEVAAVSASLDVVADRGLWGAGGQQYWRRHGERPPLPDPPPGLASPAVWREQHT